MGNQEERHQYNLGIIGNCAYLAYIDTSADVRWMCWPRFDSSFVFGNLLDQQKGGYFYVHPYEKGFSSEQYYLENANILCTEFEGEGGRFRVTDFAPRFYQHERYFKPLMLVRKIEPLSGHPKIQVGCQPVGNYGETIPESYLGSNHIRYLGLERPIRLTTDLPLNFVQTEKPLVLDRTRYCILTYGIPLEGPLESTAENFLTQTLEYWQHWVNNANLPSFYQKWMIRSALALKLHQYEDTGAILASGTTSLPEYPGEGRNWDYRFCWMRDTHYTLRSLNNLGHFEELKNYSNFIQNVVGIHGEHYEPVYSITSEADVLDEQELNLDGYLGNKPVRIGNQAVTHIQNDVYGQMLVSLLPLYTDERFVEKDQALSLKITRQILAKIEETIDAPDAGLWEFRGTEQKHCYTFLFHWAGSKAAAKIGRYFGDQDLEAKAEDLADRASQNIEACYDDEAQVYRQAIGTKNLDASLFQLITMNYLDPSSERAKKHLEKLEYELGANRYLMYRYKHVDDFGEPNSTFLICAFWYIEALAYTGRLQDAVEGFNEVLQNSNHLGLFSEDIDARTLSQWGNFPQAYSHVGLVNSAFMIANRLNRPDFLM